MEEEKKVAGGETLTFRTVGHAIDQSPITGPLVGVIVNAAFGVTYLLGAA